MIKNAILYRIAPEFVISSDLMANNQLTDEQIDRIAAKYSLPYSLHSFARELIEHDRAARIGEFPALPKPDHATVLPWDKDATLMVFFTADQMRAYAAQAVEADRAARGVPDEMAAVAEKYAHKLALDLECVLADYSGKWWDAAIKTIGEYRSAMNAIHERESPTFMGEPRI